MSAPLTASFIVKSVKRITSLIGAGRKGFHFVLSPSAAQKR
jgi:hypothetical protein